MVCKAKNETDLSYPPGSQAQGVNNLIEKFLVDRSGLIGTRGAKVTADQICYYTLPICSQVIVYHLQGEWVIKELPTQISGIAHKNLIHAL